MSSPQMNKPGESIAWGVAHSQGIAWCHSEDDARYEMARLVAADARTQAAYRGRVRLVKRTIGPLETVANPYEQEV